jgi:hypothetical protein
MTHKGMLLKKSIFYKDIWSIAKEVSRASHIKQNQPQSKDHP